MAVDLYVDTDLGNNGNPGTSPGASAKATLAGAVAAITGPIATPYIIHCKGATDDPGDVSITGKGSTATNTITIQVDQTDRHAGVWNAAKFHLVSDFSGINIAEDFVRIDGLQISNSAPGGDSRNGITLVTALGSGSTTYLSNNIIKGHNDATFTQKGINVDAANATVYAWNNILYNFKPLTGVFGIVGVTGTALHAYSNTVIGGQYSIYRDSITNMHIKNNYGGGSLTSDFQGTFATNTTNASEDGSKGITVALSTATFVNISSGTEDFHLPTGSGLIDVGTDTSGSSAPLNFTTDIDGATRTGTWDIGADEKTSTAPVPSVNDTVTLVESVTMKMDLGKVNLNEAVTVADVITMHMPVAVRMYKP